MTTPEDLRTVASACRTALEPLLDRDWERPAGDLEWSCRFTLGHMASATLFYSVNLATRSTVERHSGLVDPTIPIDELLDAVEGRALVLAEVCGAAPPDARGEHEFGRADPSGFAAMGCDEMLIHTYDITAGHGAVFDPPRDVCARVLARLFPWAPRDAEPWAALLWANGRAPLGDRPRQSGEWVWHCKPLAEWDGTDPSPAWHLS